MKKYRMLLNNTSRCFQNILPPKGTKKSLKMERTVSDNGGTPAGPVLSLEYKECGALRKSETSRHISGRLVCTTEHRRTRVSTGRASM